MKLTKENLLVKKHRLLKENKTDAQDNLIVKVVNPRSNKTFEASVNVEYELAYEDNSFDYTYGNEQGTFDPGSGWSVESISNIELSDPNDWNEIVQNHNWDANDPDGFKNALIKATYQEINNQLS